MTYVIGEPCIDIKDKSCVDVCPVELVDAVDRADVHARAVFDVDAGLGDDVGHSRRV